VLDAPGEPRLTLYDLSPTLTLLPAGRPTTDPMAGLTSVRMRSLVDEAREQFGWIIIDTPPVGALSDANLLASMADGVLLIIKADATPYHQVQRAIESLGSDRVLGTVLNRVSEKSLQSRYGYYYSYYASPRASGEVG
jgi:Mrp family chromosome partitioning ATPase